MSNDHDYMQDLYIFVKANIPFPDLLDNLAEELGEMQHHVIKAARAYRENNPTPAHWQDELLTATEEYGDVVNIANILYFIADPDKMQRKMERWKQRIIEAKEAAEQ